MWSHGDHLTIYRVYNFSSHFPAPPCLFISDPLQFLSCSSMTKGPIKLFWCSLWPFPVQIALLHPVQKRIGSRQHLANYSNFLLSWTGCSEMQLLSAWECDFLDGFFPLSGGNYTCSSSIVAVKGNPLNSVIENSHTANTGLKAAFFYEFSNLDSKFFLVNMYLSNMFEHVFIGFSANHA